MTTALVKGSMAQIAQQTGASLAETFLNVDAVIIVDTSSSMDTPDSAGGRSRYKQACRELEALQASLPGKLAVLSFANDTVFCPSGVPDFLHGSTDMAGALQFAKMADVPGIRFILISDGEPDNEQQCLAVARTYANRIDTIFVGSEISPRGRDFLQKLSAASGGLSVTADRVRELAPTVERLLLATA